MNAWLCAAQNPETICPRIDENRIENGERKEGEAI